MATATLADGSKLDMTAAEFAEYNAELLKRTGAKVAQAAENKAPKPNGKSVAPAPPKPTASTAHKPASKPQTTSDGTITVAADGSITVHFPAPKKWSNSNSGKSLVAVGSGRRDELVVLPGDDGGYGCYCRVFYAEK